jgi:single-strand DNA-binding protein
MNRIFLTGRLTADVELKQSTTTSVGNFILAVDRGKDKDGTDKGTDFPRCVVFGKTAENLAQYQGKGSKILIEGHLQTGSYIKKDGTKVYTTEVVCDKIEWLESKKAAVPDGFHEYEGDPPF